GRGLRSTVPDYSNARRGVVAVAANARRMGVSEAATEVRGDFILTPNVPSMAGPGDEFLVSLGVFNNASGGGPIRVEAQGSPALAIAGSTVTDLQVAEKKEGVAEFRVRANAVLGSGTLRFTARGES